MPGKSSEVMGLPIPSVRAEAATTPEERRRIPAPRREGEVRAPRRHAAAPQPLRGLSDRDLVLLRHLARGDSTAQVARTLSVSPNTARTRIRRVAARLGVPDRGGAAEAARNLGLQ